MRRINLQEFINQYSQFLQREPDSILVYANGAVTFGYYNNDKIYFFVFYLIDYSTVNLKDLYSLLDYTNDITVFCYEPATKEELLENPTELLEDSYPILSVTIPDNNEELKRIITEWTLKINLQ